jgi:hypothetical protein
MATTNGGGSPVPVPGAWPRAADRNAPISSIYVNLHRDTVAAARVLIVGQASVRRSLSCPNQAIARLTYRRRRCQ